MRNYTRNSIPSEHSRAEKKLPPHAVTKVPLLWQVPVSWRICSTGYSLGNTGQWCWGVLSIHSHLKKSIHCLRLDGAVSERDRLATFQLQLWVSRGMKGNELAGEQLPNK